MGEGVLHHRRAGWIAFKQATAREMKDIPISSLGVRPIKNALSVPRKERIQTLGSAALLRKVPHDLAEYR